MAAHHIEVLTGLCMSQRPTGTVTLLFTDIEGSTLLLQQLGKRYASVLIECRELLRAAFRRHHGHEVDTQGDAFFYAFARATDAVSAAVAAQRLLAAHPWSEGVALRVRMGLHTGEPSLFGEGYVGLDVHQAARIMSAGHGGQALLSQKTRELVEHDLPNGVSLRDLGEHRLKDLQRPGRVFQLIITGLPADFPPLKSLDNRPNNLPIQLTPFIGREQEMATVLDFLQREEVRLLTLTGPGGTGKTRLALQAAAELSEAFSDAVYFVNLAPISDPEFVVPAIAQTLDIKEIADQTLLSLLKASLHWKEVLLLLDNFEQVVGAAVYVAELLATCPVLKVIVTSRAALHVRGEQEFAVPPLAVPDPKHLPDLVTISHCEAVALFIQRAQSVKPEFQMTNANAPSVAEICVRLDGLPLAIELAAARIKVLPPQALLARLDQRLAVLTGGARDAPARQQTLRKTIEWSYNLLDAAEQRLFQRLSVFVGGCRLSAVEAVSEALGEERGKALAGVALLIDKSLVQQSEQEDEEPRLVMLETIREYGLEALAACGEIEATWQAHANYYLELAEEAEPELGGPQQAVWLERLERENDNLRAALRWSLERGEVRRSIEMALRLGGALGRFWEVRGHWSEGWNFLERALAGGKGVAVPVQVKALKAAAHLAWDQGDSDRAEALSEECLARCREIGDTAGIALSLRLLGAIAYSRGNLGVAYARTEEALVLFREVGDKKGIAQSLANFAHVLREQGEYKRAIALQEETLALFRAVGNIEGIAFSLLQLARVIYVSQGDPATVRALLEEGRALCREVGHKDGMSWILSRLGEVFLQQGDTVKSRSLLEESVVLSREIGKRNFAWPLFVLGKVAESQGDYAAARARYEESVALGREVGDNLSIPFYLEGLAGMVAIQGDPAWAARLWGMAECLRETMGTPLPPVYHADYQRSVAVARTHLGKQAFAAAWDERRSMTPEQALAAQDQPILSKPSPLAKSAATSPDGLTAREVEVLRLLAQGLTDAQIAENLVLSLHTIHAHLRTIYSKLGVTSRSAATRYAFEHQLV
jgi:predicted ATPase/class 3 adenylate cyclase/DNA-binding CsgD family transcriptional regulator